MAFDSCLGGDIVRFITNIAKQIVKKDLTKRIANLTSQIKQSQKSTQGLTSNKCAKKMRKVSRLKKILGSI